MEFETYTYWIAGHNLPAIINGDYTDMPDDEGRNLDGFLNTVQDRHGVGHWNAVEGTETFKTDEVSGLWADCAEMQYLVAMK